MKRLDLFPDPPDGSPKRILPAQLEIIEAQERNLASVGGVGSGKSLAAAIRGYEYSAGVPGNIGFVGRRSVPKLNEVTKRIYLEVLQRSGAAVEFRGMRDGLPSDILFSNGSEIRFRDTTDLGRHLGPEYGWIHIDEAQEEPESTWTGLSQRLRLPRAVGYHYYLITTNPPDKRHWIAKRFAKPGTWTTHEDVAGKQVAITWRYTKSRTLDNPFLDLAYVAGVKSGLTDSEIRRVLGGDYGFVFEGKGVYVSAFRPERNVGEPPTRVMTLGRSWDFGFHQPAVTWHQMFRCKEKKLHWVILEEFAGEDMESEILAKEVLTITKASFPTVPPQMVTDTGDHAGAQVSEKGPGPIIRLARPFAQGGFNLHFRHRKIMNVDPGIELVRKCLRTRCVCGQHLLVVHRRCKNTVEMFLGGYHYKGDKPGKETPEKPIKDGFYDNLADTVRYAGENLYRFADRDPGFLDELGRVQGSGIVDFVDSYAWMEGR